MTTNKRRRAQSRAAAVTNVLCAILLIVFALVLLAGWFNFAEAARGKPTSHGCRMAKHCQPVKPHATPTTAPTPIAPGCVEYGPDCVIDTTGTWPTVGPVVIVQTFPCPMSPIEEPCEPVTSTTTIAP